MPKFELENIVKLVPLAVQTGNLSGVKIIARILQSDGKEYLAFLMPPDYLPLEEVPRYIVDAAIVKYGYLPLKGEMFLNSREDMSNFVKSFEKND